MTIKKSDAAIPQILLISSYPPRECGIATFTQDLRKALHDKFEQSFELPVCALEAAQESHNYPPEVKYVLDTSEPQAYLDLAASVNADERIKAVLLQHEFGFFSAVSEAHFLHFLHQIDKPLLVAFHTVLPAPNEALRTKVSDIAQACASIIVMTKSAARILENEYGVAAEKIQVIAHGIHLVPHLSKSKLREKYNAVGRKVLSTFGLISSGKSIETTLDALPAIVAEHPNVLFLAIGKTHPGVVKHEGEQYRQMLEAKVEALSLQNHVRFVNEYVPLHDLLEYLQLTDIYLFTSKDPHQAVSGTFSYAISCGCAIVSTPIPHAKELMRNDAGILIDFQNSAQLATAVNTLLDDRSLRRRMVDNGLQRVAFAAWENAAVLHATLFKSVLADKRALRYSIPPINLGHLKRMTTSFGMLQFARINFPDFGSGYTIDDNARALVAMSMHYEQTGDAKDLSHIKTYLDFIAYCLQPKGCFLNYVNADKEFTEQNCENLNDANGRAVWALGFVISKQDVLPSAFVLQAQTILWQVLTHIETIDSPRAIAFAIKGLYYQLQVKSSPRAQALLETLANRLVQLYRKNAEPEWAWFEPYMTYGNSILPEAMLCAWLVSGKTEYKTIARQSFDFLLEHLFTPSYIKVISNQGWLKKGETNDGQHGEQPIDVAYTVMALQQFYEALGDERYREKMQLAFNWFLGQNRICQIVYNPCTGGCYDGLEASQVNVNQGAESTVSYLMARLTLEKTLRPQPRKDLLFSQQTLSGKSFGELFGTGVPAEEPGVLSGR